MTTHLNETAKDVYENEEYILSREDNFPRKWCLVKKIDGTIVDRDQYFNDLINRYDIEIKTINGKYKL